MKKLVLLFGLLITISTASAQQYGKSNFFDRVYFGGGLGFNAGTDFLTFSLFPNAGYRITDRLSAGVGISYQYTSYRAINLKLQHYGGSLFTRYIVFRNVFATTEYEYLTIEYPSNGSFSETARRGFDSWFVGGGLVQPISDNVAFTVIGLYNLLHDPTGQDSPYASPFLVRVGISVGF